VPAPDFATLAAQVAELKAAGDPAYDDARKALIWNKRLDTARSPAAVVSTRSAEEVAAAIRFAAMHGLKVSPRGSGHHYGAAALRDGSLLLDLGALDFIEVDAGARTARVGAGVLGGALSERLAVHGLAFPVGHCADVGLSGYILAGGFGWNAGEWGAACANVAAIEMVTAAGEIVLASEHRHADLFWAARGAGPGFFAAVTAYHLQLHPLPEAYAWRGVFTAGSAPALAGWLTAATDASPREVEVGCFLFDHWDTGEPAIVLRVSACGASEAEARDKVAAVATPPVRAALIDEPKGEAQPFTDLFRLSPMPAGKRVAADHLWSEAPLGELLIAVHRLRAPSPHSTIDLVAFGGHSRIALPERAALSLGGGTGAGIYALWDDAADDDANLAWVRQVDEALSSLRTGRYVGEADLTLAPQRRAECFAPEALERLGRLRAIYDPGGLFFAWP
jgi:FAD/FMN-containing dehydrogenase